MTESTGAARSRRLPRAGLIAAGAVVLLLLTIAAWSGYTHWQLARAGAQFDAGDYAAAQESADSFLTLSPFERYKGHFAAGTALAGDGRLDEAEAALTTALTTTPARDECAVRVNLALVQEGQGDAFREADDVDAADDRYDAARTTLAEAPEECRPDGSPQDEQMDAQEQRVEDAQEEMNDPSSGDAEDGGESGDDSGDGSDSGDSDSDSGDSGSGGGGGDDSPEGSGGGPTDEEGSGEADDSRMEELERRRQESEERHSQTNEGGTGSGVREPGTKPW